MTPAEVARVLAKCQAYDRRTVGKADIAAWHEALGDLDLPSALAAVAEHYRDETAWIMPAHIRRLSRTRPEHRPLREALMEQAGRFDEVANRRGLAVARAVLAGCHAPAGEEGGGP